MCCSIQCFSHLHKIFVFLVFRYGAKYYTVAPPGDLVGGVAGLRGTWPTTVGYCYELSGPLTERCSRPWQKVKSVFSGSWTLEFRLISTPVCDDVL